MVVMVVMVVGPWSPHAGGCARRPDAVTSRGRRDFLLRRQPRNIKQLIKNKNIETNIKKISSVNTLYTWTSIVNSYKYYICYYTFSHNFQFKRFLGKRQGWDPKNTYPADYHSDSWNLSTGALMIVISYYSFFTISVQTIRSNRARIVVKNYRYRIRYNIICVYVITVLFGLVTALIN